MATDKCPSNYEGQQTASLEHYRSIAGKLGDYCNRNGWAGYDPYDALNSRLFGALPFLDRRLVRLGLTQLLKRSPLNIRSFIGVPKTENPKALALFLMAFLRLSKTGLSNYATTIEHLIQRLVHLRSDHTPYWSWGYSFPWQGRKAYVPRAFPNLVCTTFVANALLDAHEQTNNYDCLSMAKSAAEYVYNELYWTEGSKAGFGYPLPDVRAPVHNANFLGAALLARVAWASNETRFLEPALKVARYSSAQQREDGAWSYGEEATQRWIDNFHTGYNLCALRSIAQYCRTEEFDTCIRRGFDFFLATFIRSDGAPKYFSDRTYPIDIHSAAQTIVTLAACADLNSRSLDMARMVLEWSIANMWDTRKEYFYYQAFPGFTYRISYMRWSQAWMLLAIATFLERCDPRRG